LRRSWKIGSTETLIRNSSRSNMATFSSVFGIGDEIQWGEGKDFKFGTVYAVQFHAEAKYYLVALGGERGGSMAVSSNQVNVVQRPDRKQVLEKLSELPDKELFKLSDSLAQRSSN
jgi:hypothetical protein